MKWILPITVPVIAVLINGDVTAQRNPTPPCRAGTLDLRARQEEDTTVNDTTAAQGLVCGGITVTEMGINIPAPWGPPPPHTESFIVRTYGDLTGDPCALWNHGFYFKVCAKQ
jgi:hypothetical protein